MHINLTYYIASAAAGAGSSVVLGIPLGPTEHALAVAFIVAFALFFGALARLAISEDTPKERRKAMMTFGALYVISLCIAKFLDVDLEGAALIAVGVGAAGPLIIIPIAEGVTRAAKAFFNRTE